MSNTLLPPQKLNVPTKLKLFFTPDKMTCDTNKATRSKTKKLIFSLAAMKFSVILCFLRHQPFQNQTIA